MSDEERSPAPVMDAKLQAQAGASTAAPVPTGKTYTINDVFGDDDDSDLSDDDQKDSDQGKPRCYAMDLLTHHR
jgi:hypothetical protein